MLNSCFPKTHNPSKKGHPTIEFDREFSNYLIDDILIDDWVLLFNQSSVSTISESSIELQQIINKEFVKNILLKIDIKLIVKNSNRDQIERFTQAIQSLNKINEVVSKKIADSVSEHFILQRTINQPLDKISKCLQDLYIYKGYELQSIVNQFDDEDIIYI